MVLYGIAAFIFIVVEFVEILPDMTSAALKAILLAREQFRFNFLVLAGSSLGYRFTVETKAALSAAKSGSNNPNYGKTPSEETKALQRAAKTGSRLTEETRTLMSAAKAGNTNATKPVLVCTLSGELVQQFSSYSAAAKFMGVHASSVTRAIQQGCVIKGIYRVSSSS
ncbi:hypothetical protein BC936DRAFT_146860 [Jimgerdemannia flammicorona]|uniref:Nuclease associated modular domain-containing protein n=1 Tax=Jimgerdemannia flammicorona TaxID=994334 RepID=A0A433D6L3_9FUNG|nr:hypothetical protein BC936DRAFT_146860 [Jimgerdemannia flammicorona]